MENGSDRASNEKFTDDDPQNGVAEAKEAMMAAIEAALGAISAAIQGAIGKIGSCFLIGTEAQIETQTTNSIYPSNSSKDNEITSLGDMLNRTGEAFKEIGSDIYNGLNERRQKALDSPYDFVNYLTLGLPDVFNGILEQNQKNGERALETGSVYDIGNWLTMGSFDMVKGAFNPEEPLSKEHWMNSLGVASMLFGAREAKVTPGKSLGIEDIKTGPKVTNECISISDDVVEDAFKFLDDIKGGGNAKFQYKHNPSDSPKVLLDAVEDTNAVYGYKPNNTGSLKKFVKYDWSNPDVVAKFRNNRLLYHIENDGYKELVNSMRADGYSDVEIAKTLVKKRNANRLSSYINEDGKISDIELYNQAKEHCVSYEELKHGINGKPGKSDLQMKYQECNVALIK